MTNIFFPDEEIKKDDVYFICYMIERTARKLHQRNRYVANAIGKPELERLLSLANVLHCENPLKTETDWITEYGLENGDFDITDVDTDLADTIPSSTQMGKVYTRLIFDTMADNENYADAIIRVYNDPICDIIDNYSSSAYYEPSYVIAEAYKNGEF